MGLLEMKKANFKTAQGYFEKAIQTLTTKNPNPYDGEAYYNLGLALRFQYDDGEAYKAFYKAIWNDAWQASGYFQLAQIATKKEWFEEALELTNKSLLRQWHNHKARHLKSILLRKTQNKEQAIRFIEESLELDHFNFGLYYEKFLLLNKGDDLQQLKNLIRDNLQNYIEISLDYAWAGCFEEAISILEIGVKQQKMAVYPMAWYFLGWYYNLKNEAKDALECYKKAENAAPGTCFPNRLEAVLALKDCISTQDDMSKAYYYLGNFLYHKKEYKSAISLWEKSAIINSSFPTVHRNLALGLYNKSGKKEEALKELENAFELDKTDSRILMELDALYKRLNYTYLSRLKNLDNYPQLVDFRDDLYLEKITLLNFVQKHQDAYDLIMKRKFHPWEGGEGKVTGQYVLSLIEMAKENISAGNYPSAIEKLEKTKAYPHNLGEGKLYGAQENDINYWLGYCYDKMADRLKAAEFFTMASTGKSELSAAVFYNDQQPDKIFYQGLAHLKLANNKEADRRFETLINYGKEHMNDQVKIDYFAVSLPDLQIWDDDLNVRNQLHCKYLMALGYLGQGNTENAKKLLQEVCDQDLYHTGAFIHLEMMKTGLI